MKKEPKKSEIKNCDFLEVSAQKASKSGFVGSSGRSDGPFGTDPSSSRAKYGPIMPKIRIKKYQNFGPEIYMDEYPRTVYFWHILIDRAHLLSEDVHTCRACICSAKKFP